jgi:cytochrome c553
MAEIPPIGAIQGAQNNIRRANRCGICHEVGHNSGTCRRNPNFGQPRQRRQRRQAPAVNPQGMPKGYLQASFIY